MTEILIRLSTLALPQACVLELFLVTQTHVEMEAHAKMQVIK